MNRIIRSAACALAATLGLAAAETQAAGDITFRNASSTFVLHPYFRSNCWNPVFGIVPDQYGWVFFGGVLSGTQFTWTTFQDLLDPSCPAPKVEFTYTIEGAPGAQELKREVREKMDYRVPADHLIVVVDHPVIQRDD